MKRLLLFAAAVAATVTAAAQPQLRSDNIEEVLRAMTLEEKATLLAGDTEAVLIDGIPSGAAVKVLGAAGNTRPLERLGIPETILADGPAGVRIAPVRPDDGQTYYATGFPIGTLLASSWDTQLVERVTAAMGNEVLEYGVDMLLAPGMNIHRNPLNGRNFEYFSEDPLLSGKIAAAYVRGIQSNGVGTSVKHYAANNQETNRLENDARISERTLREIYLKNFEIAVRESSPWCVMSSYNKLNGEYTQQREDLLTSILRDEWGYRGIVITDWGCKEGTVKAAHAGNDLMAPGNRIEIERIIAAVRNGTLSMEDVDRNVRNMLEYIVKTPSFRKYPYSNRPDLKAHAATAREAAAESMVLLRNEDNTLPLAGGTNVALYGVTSLDFISGGTGSGFVNTAYTVNMKDALESAGFRVDKSLSDYYRAHLDMTAAAAALTKASARLWLGGPSTPEIAIPEKVVEYEAGNNDAAIVVIGRNAGEGADRRVKDDFELTAVERELLRSVSTAFHARGKRVIVVLNIGGAIETHSWKNMADAILLPWSPGQEGANAVADVLSGKVNPSGKLPMTLPVSFMDHPSSANFPYLGESGTGGPRPRKDIDYTNYEEGIYVGYRYFTTAGKEVSYPFGYGLSYTTFAYSDPAVKATADGFEASVTVTNSGSTAGREVVELYVSAPAGGIEKPARELKAFGKTRTLNPGESQRFVFRVDNYDLASFSEQASAWQAAAGVYVIGFGASVEDLRAEARYRLGRPAEWKTGKLFRLDEPLHEMSLVK